GTGQEMTLPVNVLSVVWLGAPQREADAESLRRRLATQCRTRDLILLRNGDTIEGTWNALDTLKLLVEVEGKEVRVERDRVAAIALNTDLVRPLRPQGAYAHLVLSNGSRLGLASAQASAKTLTGKTLFGVAAEVPLEQLAALDLRQSGAVYLSDLKPRGY